MCYQTQEGLWNFSKISSSQHYPYSFPLFQNYYKRPFYFPSFYHLPRLIILFFLKKVVETSTFKIWIENYPSKRELQMIQIRPFQEKEMEGGEKRSQFGGQWKVPLLGGPWNFTFSHFPPNKFYLTLKIFPLTLRFYFTMVTYAFPSFFLTYKLRSLILM